MKRDKSLEKAARKFAEADGWGDVSQSGIFVRSAVRFATRHGAKVRRETLKDVLDLVVAHNDCSRRGNCTLADEISALENFKKWKS